MIEEYLRGLVLSEIPELDAAMRYALEGGKRIRARLCLAAASAAGGDPASALPAAAALELVQAFSLVHDDLPALDDDTWRRGRHTAHVEFGEAVAILTGDGLLNAAFLLVSRAPELPPEARTAVIAELAQGVAGMVDGQYLDVTGGDDLDLDELRRLHRLKTGALISASIGCGLHVAGLGEAEQRPYRGYARELGLLFQIVDDILDGDADGEPSYVATLGMDRARELAAASRARALELLGQAGGSTGELEQLTVLIADRTA
ncbi:MAG: polyprenyl synthetase family protein [Gaiellales bacterium]